MYALLQHDDGRKFDPKYRKPQGKMIVRGKTWLEGSLVSTGCRVDKDPPRFSRDDELNRYYNDRVLSNEMRSAASRHYVAAVDHLKLPPTTASDPLPAGSLSNSSQHEELRFYYKQKKAKRASASGSIASRDSMWNVLQPPPIQPVPSSRPIPQSDGRGGDDPRKIRRGMERIEREGQ
jgi:hypothetical protein